MTVTATRPRLTTLFVCMFALATTAYVLIAVQLEERDLIDAHGADYEDYRRRVPMLIPRLARRRAAQPPRPAEART